MTSLEKWLNLTPLQKLPENVGDLGKLIVVKGFKKLPKVQKFAQSGHTDANGPSPQPTARMSPSHSHSLPINVSEFIHCISEVAFLNLSDLVVQRPSLGYDAENGSIWWKNDLKSDRYRDMFLPAQVCNAAAYRYPDRSPLLDKVQNFYKYFGYIIYLF